MELMVSTIDRCVENETRVGEADKIWLSSLAYRDITDEDITEINRVIDVGSLHLTDDVDPETVRSVMNARERFFEDILDWNDGHHPMHKTYDSIISLHPRIMPLDTLINTQQEFYELGIEGSTLLKKQPAAISISIESVREKMRNFAELGIDGAAVVNKLPSTIGLNPKAVKLKVSLLREYYKNAPEQYAETLRDVSTVANLLITPLESLTIHLGTANLDKKSYKKGSGQCYTKSLGINTAAERKDYMRDNLSQIIQGLGCKAVHVARYNKTDDPTKPYWLEGEVIDHIPLANSNR